MSFVQLGRLMAVLALIGALLAMVLVQQERGEKRMVSHSMPAASVANPLRAELVHCKQLNAEAATAAGCDAAWARIRDRFLGHGGAENGTLHDEVAAAPNVRGR
jgi:conjugative transfer region protein TrbK